MFLKILVSGWHGTEKSIFGSFGHTSGSVCPILLIFCMLVIYHKRLGFEYEFEIFDVWAWPGMPKIGPKINILVICQRTLHQIFLIFFLKLEAINGFKLTQVVCFRTFLFAGGMGLKSQFFGSFGHISGSVCPILLVFCLIVLQLKRLGLACKFQIFDSH